MLTGTVIVCGGIMVGTFLGIREFIRIASKALVKNVLIRVEEQLEAREQTRRIKNKEESHERTGNAARPTRRGG